MATITQVQRADSHQGQVKEVKVGGTGPKHFNDWPNAAGVWPLFTSLSTSSPLTPKQFNALGDTREKIPLKVSGTIPSTAAGTLFRTGPGGYKVSREKPEDGEFAASHWFDGFSTIHKFELVQGNGGTCSQVFYSSYCQTDKLIENVRKTGRMDGVSFGQKRDPCDSLYRKVKSVFTPVLPGDAHTSNVGVVFRQTLPAERVKTEKDAGESNVKGRRLLTLTTDARTSKHFDADTLEPLGVAEQEHLHPALNGPLSSAHAAHDPETGDIYNYNLALGAKAVYRVFRASQSGEVEILAEISGSDIKGAYIHSMHITQNFVVLCIWPSFLSAAGASILWQRNIMDALAPFDSKAQATWCVVDRRHGRGLVKKFKSPAFFCFHTTNAWEEVQPNDPNTVDLICEQVEFNNLDILHMFYYKNLVSNEKDVNSPEMQKWRETVQTALVRHKLCAVPLTGTTAATSKSTSAPSTQEILRIPSPHAGDLPRYNPHRALQPHRYVWCILNRGKASFTDGLGKTDTQTGECTVWERRRHTPGEPIFLPSAAADAAEDNGIVLSVVLDGDTGTSYLLCLDAKTMEEVGRADVPTPVGLGFHGMHVPASV